MDIPGIDIPGPGEAVGGIGGFFGGLAEDAGQAVIDYVFIFIFELIAQAVAAITGALAKSFNGASTKVDLVGGWFTSEAGSSVTTMTSVIAGSLVLVFLFLSLIRAMAAGEFSSMWRAALIDVPAAFLATALTVVVASALLAMVDEASASLLGEDGEQLAAFGNSLADVDQLTLAGLLGILFGLLFIVGAVLVWIQLLVRAALIYILIAFAPITWVTRAYPGTRSIAKRGVEVGIALIISKFVMAISFRLGAEAMASSGAAEGEADLAAMLVGASIMLMTAFMPWMIFKVIPAVESAPSAAGPQGAAIGAAMVGGGLAFAGLKNLAGGSSGDSGQSSGGGSASAGEGGTGSASGGGGSGGEGGGGAGVAAGAVASVAKSAAETGSKAANATGEIVKASSSKSSETSGGNTSQSGSSTGGGAGYQATPLGGSPGIVEIEIEDSPPPANQTSEGGQPLARLRKKRDQS